MTGIECFASDITHFDNFYDTTWKLPTIRIMQLNQPSSPKYTEETLLQRYLKEDKETSLWSWHAAAVFLPALIVYVFMLVYLLMNINAALYVLVTVYHIP